MARNIIYGFNCYEKLESWTSAYTLYASELKENGLEKVVEKRIERFADIYYFSKHPDWKEENEYRLLVRDKSNENPIIELDGILEGIVLGIQADDLLHKPIQIMIERFSAIPDIYKLHYFNQSYFLIPFSEKC